MSEGLKRRLIKEQTVRGKRARFKRVAIVLMSVVAFATTYALVLPALTLEKTPSFAGGGGSILIA